jgi:hypothetical protein
LEDNELRVKCITVPLTSTVSGFSWSVRSVVASDSVTSDAPISITAATRVREKIDVV